MERQLEAISLFSGAMGLDLGIEQASISIAACVEIDKSCCSTIRANRPHLPIYEKGVRAVTGERLLRENNLDPDHLLMVGGPPCQSFSSGGNRAALNDPRGNLILEYFRLINEIRPVAFLFENVGQLLTAALRHRPINERPGKRWNLHSYSGHRPSCTDDDALPLAADEKAGSAFMYLLGEIEQLGYSISFEIVNAADYGAPQKRIRFVMVGFRDVCASGLPAPLHGETDPGLPRYVTLRDSISDLTDAPGAHSIYTEWMASYFEKIPPGGNWRSLSEDDQKKILGRSYYAGGGKTGFMRRLAWDEPAPTLTTKPNRKGTALCHPSKIRPLSVKEYARIQGFPDDWVFTGAMNRQYEQIGNAVPVALGRVTGTMIRDHLSNGASQKPFHPSDELDLLRMYDKAVKKLRSYARNKRGNTEMQGSML